MHNIRTMHFWTNQSSAEDIVTRSVCVLKKEKKISFVIKHNSYARLSLIW